MTAPRPRFPAWSLPDRMDIGSVSGRQAWLLLMAVQAMHADPVAARERDDLAELGRRIELRLLELRPELRPATQAGWGAVDRGHRRQPAPPRANWRRRATGLVLATGATAAVVMGALEVLAAMLGASYPGGRGITAYLGSLHISFGVAVATATWTSGRLHALGAQLDQLRTGK